MFKRLALTLALLVGGAATASAAAVDIDLNDFSVQGHFVQAITQDNYGTSQLDVRALYNDHKETTLASAGVDFLGKPGNVPGLDVGVGGMALVGQAGDSPFEQDLLVVAIGARANFVPPALMGVGFAARLAYGPKILCFADAERLLEVSGRVNYAITPKVKLFAEYQNIHLNVDGGSGDIDDGVRVGFEARF